MGTKYTYQIWEGDKLVDEGLSSDLGKKYFVSGVCTYANTGHLMLGKYRVTKRLRPFYPKHGQKYYYYALNTDGVIQGWWSDYSGLCMVHYKSGNMFETQEQCRKYGRDLMADICAEFRTNRKIYEKGQ